MNSDPILERIWRVQSKLARKAGYDPKTYARNADSAVRAVEKKYGLVFRYADASELPAHPLKVAEGQSEYIVRQARHGSQRGRKC
jgi:hypothetical protein